MFRTVTRITLGVILAATLLTTGCSNEYGYSRSVFQGKVVDQTAEGIESFAGKPDAVETMSSGDVIWTFNKRTFDSENGNANDAAVKLTLRKDAKSGALSYAGIDFVSL
jgi:hypothetical protein